MNISENRVTLYYIIATLVVIKFVLVPWLSWQNELVRTNTKIENQIAKGLSLVEQQSTLKDLYEKLHVLNEESLTLVVGKEKTALAFQLKVQKDIESLMSELDISARSVSWLAPVYHENMEEHRIEIALSGNMKNFIQFMIEVEKVKPKLAIIEFRSNISKMKPNQKKLGRFIGKIVISGWKVLEEDGNEK